MLQKLPAKLFTILLLLVYLAVGITGCCYLEEGLRPQNLMMPDFHAYKYFMYNEEYFYPMGLQVEIVVNSATNLTLPHERERIQEIVHEFESTPHTMGSVATDFFLPEYLNYLKTGGIENV